MYYITQPLRRGLDYEIYIFYIVIKSKGYQFPKVSTVSTR